MDAADRWRTAGLLLALATVAFVAYQPHAWPGRDPFPYPIHLDEHLHWGFARAAQDTGSIAFGDPFTGEDVSDFSLGEHLHERGFHAYLAAFQELSGIPWLPLFQFAPAVLAMLLALAAYALAQRWGAGPEAALAIALIPTTLRFLGPGFLVPIAFALPILIAGLLPAFSEPSARSLALMGIFAFALWPIHVIAAVSYVALVTIHALVSTRASTWGALAAIGAVALPFFLARDFYERAFTGKLDTLDLPPSFEDIRLIGVLPLLLATAGAVWLALRGGREARIGATLTLGLLVAAIPLLQRAFYGEDPFLLYDRAVLMLFVLVALLAGTGAAALRKGLSALAVRASRASPRVRGPLIATAIVLCLAVQGAAVAQVAQANAEREFYHILDAGLYEAMQDAQGKLGPEHERAIVAGRAGMAFTALSGRPNLYVDYPWSTTPDSILDFFFTGANDTYFLVETRTSVVVTPFPVTNPDLVRVNEFVYVLKPEYAQRMSSVGRDGTGA